MKRRSLRYACAAAIAGVLCTLTFVPSAPAQEEKSESMRIMAIAQGTSTQLGTIVNVTITIREQSTEEERQALIGAFKAKGSAGLSRALGKMSAKGRIAITGTLGYDINYVRIYDTPNGRVLRFVTDRPVTFREAYYDTRSRDYNLSAGEVELFGEKGKGKGTLLPACEFTLDKEGQLSIDLRRNAWKLVSVDVRE